MPANKINQNETIASAFPKINKAIEESYEALQKSSSANENSNVAIVRSRNVETQLKTLVIHNGESDAEVLLMRIDEDGVEHDTAAERIASDYDKMKALNSETKENVNQIVLNVKTYGAKGNGVADDTIAIQQALDEVESYGSAEVYVPQGTYNLTGELYIKKNTTFHLHHEAVLMRNHAGNLLRNYTLTDEFSQYNGNGNITIQGGVFDCNGANVQRVCNGIALAHAENITLNKITIKDIYEGHGVELTGIRNWKITNSFFLGFKGNNYYSEAIQVEFAGIGTSLSKLEDGTYTQMGICEGNYFGNSGTPGFQAWPCGIGSHGSLHDIWYDFISVLNNTFEGCTYWAIRPFKWSNAIIRGNKIKNCPGGGIYVVIPATGSASTKDLVGNPHPAQPIQNISIDGNILSGLGGKGILLEGKEDAKIYRAKLDGNILDNIGGNAIEIRFVSDSNLNGHVINSAGGNGIMVVESSHLDLTNNRLTNIGYYGLNIATNSQNVDLISNKIINPSQAEENRYDGITVGASVSDVKITDTRIRTTSGKRRMRYGVMIYAGVTGIQRYGNDFRTNAMEMNLRDASTNPVTSSGDVS